MNRRIFLQYMALLVGSAYSGCSSQQVPSTPATPKAKDPNIFNRLEQIERNRNASTAPVSPASLNAQLYPFPPAPITSGVGVCLSGGGSRAASASMGELRGLRSLGLLDRVSALSTVSGGSWAGITFTYLPSDISDDEFLGGVVPNPGDLTWVHHSGENQARALDALSGHALGSLCTRIGLVEFLAEVAKLQVTYHDSPHVLWCRAVGVLILEPFGLGDITQQGSPSTYYSSTLQWLKSTILGDGRNPTLSASDFNLVQKSGRPYLITNSTIFSPSGVHLRHPAPGSPPLEPYPFEASVTGAGVPFPLQGRLGGGEPSIRLHSADKRRPLRRFRIECKSRLRRSGFRCRTSREPAARPSSAR